VEDEGLKRDVLISGEGSVEGGEGLWGLSKVFYRKQHALSTTPRWAAHIADPWWTATTLSWAKVCTLPRAREPNAIGWVRAAAFVFYSLIPARFY